MALQYDAAPGERNEVTFEHVDDGVMVRDAGAVLEPGPGCERVDDHAARCSTGGARRLDYLRLRAGDGDDTVTTRAGVRAEFLAGPGDDRLTVGDAADAYLDGDAGTDTLTGGGGSDFIAEGDDDEVGVADIYDGGTDGPGEHDTIAYILRDRGVTVDLSGKTTSGAAGGREGDRVTGIEEAWGGDGHDILLGTPGRDIFDGLPGVDVVRGRGGDDRLRGRRGRDRLHGGTGSDLFLGGRGNDTLFARDGARDEGSGGRGRDRARADRVDSFTSVEVRL